MIKEIYLSDAEQALHDFKKEYYLSSNFVSKLQKKTFD